MKTKFILPLSCDTGWVLQQALIPLQAQYNPPVNCVMLCQGISPPFYMFSFSHFLWNENEGRKQKERVDYIMGGSCTCAFSWFLGTPSGSWPPVPFPNVNALIWKPPLQLKSSGGLSNTSRELGSDSWSRLSKILQCPTPSVWPHAGTENHSRSWRWPTSHQCRPQVGQGEPAPMLVPWPFWVSTLSGHIKPKKC